MDIRIRRAERTYSLSIGSDAIVGAIADVIDDTKRDPKTQEISGRNWAPSRRTEVNANLSWVSIRRNRTYIFPVAATSALLRLALIEMDRARCSAGDIPTLLIHRKIPPLE